jgi:hypothetical protein
VSESESVKLPEIPGELWMLWKIGTIDGDGYGPGWCVAYNNPPSRDNYLVCFSEADAIQSADYQARLYGILCRPVRVK